MKRGREVAKIIVCKYQIILFKGAEEEETVELLYVLYYLVECIYFVLRL